MEHVVFYPGTDGNAAFRRVPSLEEAVRLVEHLRNVEGIASLSVHAMTEVPMEFKAYYRVEVPPVPVEGQPAAAEPRPEPEPKADTAGAEAELVGVEAGGRPESNGHGEVSSLGFFAP